MAFTIKTLGPLTINVLGANVNPNATLDLTTIASNAEIVTSLNFGQLYDQLFGRMICVVDPNDFYEIGATQEELNLYEYAGFLQGRAGDTQLHYPLRFNHDGYVMTQVEGLTIDSSGLIVSIRGDMPVPADRDSILAMGTDDGTIAGTPHVMLVEPDGTVNVVDHLGDGYLDELHNCIMPRATGYEQPTIAQDVLVVDDIAPTIIDNNYSTSRNDGTAVRAGDTTITFTTTFTVTTIQIRKVIVDDGTTIRVFEQGKNSVRMVVSGGAPYTITINGAGATPVPATTVSVAVIWVGPDKAIKAEDSAAASGDYGVVGLEVRRDVPVSSAGSDGDYATSNQDADGFHYVRDKAYDSATNANRIAEVAPIWSRNVQTPVSLIAAAQNLTNAWADLGPEVALQGYSKIGLWLNIDVNDSTNVRVRCLVKHTAADTKEYSYVISATDISGVPFNIKVQGEYMELDVDADQLILLPWNLWNFIPYIQLQIMAEVAGASPGQVLNAYVTYGYGG